MKTDKTSSTDSNVDPVFFGIPLNCSKANRAKYKKLIAGLFLNPKIKSRYVTRYIVQLENGLISIDRLLKLIDNGVLQGDSFNQPNGSNLSENMHDKIKDWIDAFGEPTDSDWAYLEKQYNLNRELLVGVEKDTPRPVFHGPKEMAEYVSQTVFGQDEVINALSVPIFQQNDSMKNKYHFRITTPMVLIGPPGTGKSRLCQAYKRISECPVIYINCSEFSPTSWKGEQLSEILVRQIKEGYTIEQLKYAIIFFDEFDKIPHYNNKIVGEKGDNYDQDKMNQIMGLFDEVHEMFLGDGFNQDGSPKGFNLPVADLLPIFAGAFTGIEDIVRKRLKLEKPIGFKQSDSDMNPMETEFEFLRKQVSIEDLETWGFSRELLDRIGKICILNSFTPDTIYNIMTNTKDNILQSHIDYCHLHNIDLRFTSEALRLIAEVAYQSKCGFRRVKPKLYDCLFSLYFEELNDLPKSQTMHTINIDREYTAKHLNLLTK